MDFEKLNWSVLERLRAGFLSGTAANGPYWTSDEDLAQYDQTFGERIGWKWDAVLSELTERKWTPVSTTPASAAAVDDAGANPLSEFEKNRFSVLDWGCGSGIAGRRVIAFLGVDHVSTFSAWDHSPLARQFAVKKAVEEFPGLKIVETNADANTDILILSHVVNELDPDTREQLVRVARRAQIVLWVEPGTHAVSRELIGIRETLRNDFELVAPCTHCATCGLLTPENAGHWCHAFAPPPPAIYADSDWVKFGQRAGIDLRSLPYSFLVLQKPKNPTVRELNATVDAPTASAERILGDPRHYKGFVKLLSCGATGVRELMLQKRDDPARYKALKRETGVPIYRWTLSGEKILSTKRVHEERQADIDPWIVNGASESVGAERKDVPPDA